MHFIEVFYEMSSLQNIYIGQDVFEEKHISIANSNLVDIIA